MSETDPPVASRPAGVTNAKVGFEASFPGIESSAVFGETQYPGGSTIYPGRY